MSGRKILLLRLFRPVDREAYTQRSLERAFPSGEWVEDLPPRPTSTERQPHTTGRDPGVESGPAGNNLTVIGSAKDLEPVYDEIGRRRPDKVILGRLKSGRGAESEIAKMLEGCGFSGEVVEVETDPDLYGKADVNVDLVMSYDLTSPVLLVGNNARVKKARSWLGRAEWGREIVELPRATAEARDFPPLSSGPDGSGR